METIKQLSKLTSIALARTLLSLGLVFPGALAMAIEEPAFDLIETEGDIEFRRYQPYIIAQTLVKEARSRSAASNAGFMRLFGYISGENTAQEKIEMTAPVIQADGKSQGEKIDMTAPVQQTETEEGWLVAFVLPLHYTMETAPIPEDSRIQLREIAPRTMAVIQFSGRWSEKNVERHKEELLSFLDEDNQIIIGDIEFAAYNSPFALPFLRRNEVMVEVKLQQ